MVSHKLGGLSYKPGKLRKKGAIHGQMDRMSGYHRAHTISGLERKWPGHERTDLCLL